MSQPAVSGHIKALEEGFGVTLFERSSTGMSLTPSGRRLLSESAQIIDAVERLKHSAQALRGEPTGKLKLGTVLEPSVLRVGDLMVQARDRYPQIELELVQVMSSDALARVRGGALDASFYFGNEPEPDLASVELRDIVYHVTMPVAWAAELESAPWEDLARRPWIVAPEPSTHRRLVMELFHAPTPSPERIVEADNESVINNLVESGVGVSLIRDEIATQSVDAGRSVHLAGVARDDEALARPSRRPHRRSAGRGPGRCAAVTSGTRIAPDRRRAPRGRRESGTRAARRLRSGGGTDTGGRRARGAGFGALGAIDGRIGATPAEHRQRGTADRQCQRRQRRPVASEERDDSRHARRSRRRSRARSHMPHAKSAPLLSPWITATSFAYAFRSFIGSPFRLASANPAGRNAAAAAASRDQ